MTTFDRTIATLLGVLAAGLCCFPLTAQQNTVAVFILAGQSNMEGKAQNKLLEHQATAPATKAAFAAYRNEDNSAWRERDDVFIKFLGRHGNLTMGYGSKDRTGCELAFGHYVGDRMKRPVLLIKTAWGGRSIKKDFRPPSAGLPDDEALGKELEDRIKRAEKRKQKAPTMAELKAEYGKDYRAMIHEVHATLDDMGKLFPKLRGKKARIEGFVWFQGWNDQYGGAEQEYESNLTHLIHDVRAEFSVADLPVVIGAMGQNGSTASKGAMKVIQDAQFAVGRTLANVETVATDVLVDRAAETLYPEWKQRFEEWERTGSDHRYHYLGSALWFNAIGQAFGSAMMRMLE